MNIDYKTLQVFAMLLEERSVTRTANQLNMTQSAVSHAITRLRDFFDDPLFVSTGRGMEPTSRAQELSSPLAETIESLNFLCKPAREFDPSSFKGTFEIATTDYIGLILLPLLIKRLSEMSPGMELVIKPLSTTEDVGRLKNDEIDLIIWNERMTPPNFYRRELFSDYLRAIVRTGHPCIEGELSLEQFREGKHLCISSNHGALKEDVDSVYRCGCQIAVKVPHFLMAYILVSQSDLIGMIADLTARKIARMLPLQVLDLPVEVAEFTVSQVWHERRHTDAAHRWLRGEIAAVAEEIRKERAQS